MAPITLGNEAGLRVRWILKLILVLTLIGCAKKEVAPPLQPQQNAGKEMDRYQWLLANSAGDYLKVGTRNAKWDSLVLQAFTNQSRARMKLDNGNWGDAILKASEAGCTDPLVGYWRVRADYGDADRATMASLSLWTNGASALAHSGYSPYRKFYASLRAFEAMRATRKAIQPDTPERTNWTVAFSFYMNSARINAAAVAGDPQAPAEEVLLLVEDFFSATEWASESRQRFVDQVEPALLRGHPTAPQTGHLLGSIAVIRAWLARGNDYADKTSDKQFRDFETGLDKAEQLLIKAWKTQPRVETAIHMMQIQLGRANSRNELEHWFREGMALQPNSYATARAKYYYLEPKWHGSREEQHEFAVECVASTDWGGNVPQIMLDYYADIEPSDLSSKADFYARPEVWSDVQKALNQLLKLNPEESGWHYNFFKFAYFAGDWTVAARELEAMGEVDDYTYFGGKEQFNEMTKRVRAETAAANKKQ